MARSPRQTRVQRAETLAEAHPALAEILRFYADVARLQDDLYSHFAKRRWPLPGSGTLDIPELLPQFPLFLDRVAQRGSPPLKQTAQELKSAGAARWEKLLSACWQGGGGPLDPQSSFFGRGFLQPIAELARDQVPLSLKDYSQPLCPYCGRAPGLAILRPEGEGAKRSLQCSFCLAEWNFRRILCPACGEEDNQKLPVYTAGEFDYIRVEACDACKHYLKSVDLTRNGRAEPLVDEIAAAPLDLWARDHGYTKIALNLLGM